MKYFRAYITKLDRSGTAQSGRKPAYRALLATTIVVGTQLLGVISANTAPVPTPDIPSPLLPTRFILNGGFEDVEVKHWKGPAGTMTETNNAYNATRYNSTTDFSSVLGVSGTNIATANVRQGYKESQLNAAIKPVIWLSSESNRERNLWNYSQSIEIFRGNCSPTSTQANITDSRLGNYDPCWGRTAQNPSSGVGMEGQQFAEIQGSALATLYQDIYVLPNETVNWSLRHAARLSWDYTKATPEDQTNTMQVSITDPDPQSLNKPVWTANTPPINQANGYYSGVTASDISTYAPTATSAATTTDRPYISTKYTDGWKQYQGKWISTNNSPKQMRFGFTSVRGSTTKTGTKLQTFGNFIDDVRVKLPALVEFLQTDAAKNVHPGSHTEGNAPANPNYYYLGMRINGQTGGGTVTISLTGLTESRKFRLGTVLGKAGVTGLTATNNGNNTITLTIPAATYNPNLPNDYIYIPIDFSDTIPQPTDDLLFSITAQTGDLNIQTSPGADPRMGILSVQTELIDDDVVAPAFKRGFPTPNPTPAPFQKKVELPIRIAKN